MSTTAPREQLADRVVELERLVAAARESGDRSLLVDAELAVQTVRRQIAESAAAPAPRPSWKQPERPARQYDHEIDELADIAAGIRRLGVPTEYDAGRLEHIAERIVDLASNRLPVSVTIDAGIVARVSAQTAYNDHDVQLVPGTYPLTYSSWPSHSLHAEIPAVELPWWNVTAGFAGVAYAGEQRGGDATTYWWSVDTYNARQSRTRRPAWRGVTYNY